MSRRRVCLVGASGRMGRRVVRLLRDHATLQLEVVLGRPGHAVEGLPVETSAQLALKRADVVIDFAAPTVCGHLAPQCAAMQTPYVLASTGLKDADEAAVAAAAARVAVLQAANLSRGVNVMLELVEQAAAKLREFDMEISEIHHRHKRDAPSGTALALGEAVQRGAGPRAAVLGRQGASQGRGDGELGFAALRGGEVAGEHTVYFFGRAERLEITHRSTSGDIFAAGALDAAAWLIGKPAGRYTMRDVLRRAG